MFPDYLDTFFNGYGPVIVRDPRHGIFYTDRRKSVRINREGMQRNPESDINLLKEKYFGKDTVFEKHLIEIGERPVTIHLPKV